MTGELTTLYVGSDHCISLYRNLILWVVHEDPLPGTLRLLPGWMKRLRQNNGEQPIGFIIILRPNNPPPAEAARGIIRQIFKIFSETVQFGAVAVEKTGFRAATQRSALNVILLAVRPPFPLKVCASADEASQWVLSEFGGTAALQEASIIDTIEGLKVAYEAGALKPSL
jgi:hypothetical protein